jgi:YegS/Rv2252/BmrU family lipid kinase
MQEETLEQPAALTRTQTTAIIIVNPTSGSYTQNKQQIEETLAFLRQHHWQVELRLTEEAGDAERFAQEAVEQKLQVVIAVGGDGTINEVIQALAGSDTALGVLPSGTVNVWARETGIPLNNAGALDVLVNGRTRRIDLGYTSGRYFLLMAGVGFDGEVTHAVEKKPVKRFGVLGYLVVGTWLGLGYPSFRASLQVDGRTVKVNALQIVIGNTQLYGGAIKYTWRAKCDDGLLDVCILKKQTMLGRIAAFFDFLFHRAQRHQWVLYETCSSLKIRTKRPLAMQIDGNSAGHINKSYPPATFNSIPGALNVIVPQHSPAELFSQA